MIDFVSRLDYICHWSIHSYYNEANFNKNDTNIFPPNANSINMLCISRHDEKSAQKERKMPSITRIDGVGGRALLHEYQLVYTGMDGILSQLGTMESCERWTRSDWVVVVCCRILQDIDFLILTIVSSLYIYHCISLSIICRRHGQCFIPRFGISTCGQFLLTEGGWRYPSRPRGPTFTENRCQSNLIWCFVLLLCFSDCADKGSNTRPNPLAFG